MFLDISFNYFKRTFHQVVNEFLVDLYNELFGIQTSLSLCVYSEIILGLCVSL